MSFSQSIVHHPLLDQQPAGDRDLFAIRAELFTSDAEEALFALYGQQPDYDDWLSRFYDIIAEGFAARPDDLKKLDQQRVHIPDWFQKPHMMGYSAYADRFGGTLAGVADRLDYLADMGITYLHLMPITKPCAGENDGGYAVEDYEMIDPRLGTMADLERLAAACRDRGISLVSDLALNHTADSHVWAKAAKAGDPHYQAYYHCFPDRRLPDLYEQSLDEVFPINAPGNFTHIPQMDRWVWTTFYPYQWDLNYSNPAVFAEMLRIMLQLANRGVEVLRLDSVAFMWKAMGTDCRNQPQAHQLLRAFRALLRIAAPALALKAEAIVAPEHLTAYLGEGAHAGKECQLGYHNTLMVLLWSALAEGRADRLTRMLRRMPSPPANTSWITYVRCHDDIGWPVLDVEREGDGPSDHVRFLSAFYAGQSANSFARGQSFQTGEDRAVHGTSGMLASLAGLESACDAGNDQAITQAMARISLLHSIIFAFGGIPLLYMGDELGMLNDHDFEGDPQKAADTRWLHRPIMDWAKAEERHEKGSLTHRIYSTIRHLIDCRADFPALHGDTPSRPLSAVNPHIFVMRRSGARGRLLLLANFSASPQIITADEVIAARFRFPLKDRLSQSRFDGLDDLVLAPYACHWLEETNA
ncbi:MULTISPECIES: alpha-amylase family protein [unclassified Iodidimonas]|jgi:amylosucrase|uniref:alpha-amylase family protein n=1 Tax=unclassified Iodidimonas TaxID=2626145 RepID=UPI002482754E|nr:MULTISPECIES: alpha-amylase family protein [unclassified Iodidimonas]